MCVVNFYIYKLYRFSALTHTHTLISVTCNRQIVISRLTSSLPKTLTTAVYKSSWHFFLKFVLSAVVRGVILSSISMEMMRIKKMQQIFKHKFQFFQFSYKFFNLSCIHGIKHMYIVVNNNSSNNKITYYNNNKKLLHWHWREQIVTDKK